MVNDLNQMVRKKKKTTAPNGDSDANGKRKAEDEGLTNVGEAKKVKVEDAAETQ